MRRWLFQSSVPISTEDAARTQHGVLFPRTPAASRVPWGRQVSGAPPPTHHVTWYRVRAINLPRPPAFFAGRLTIARPRAVFLQNLHDVSPSLSFLFLSRACK